MQNDNNSDHQWISRCFAIARRGIGNVSPNPPVGAVLVHNGKILSEGYHRQFGGPHAEVEVFQNVELSQRHLIPECILYVSLEPCCITRKTPPCTDLIIREGIKDVRISTYDPNPDISGKGIDLLRKNGIQVECGILEEEGQELIRPFAINILEHRPFVILKWAQSLHGYMGGKERIWLSHPHTNAWTHKQRSMADAIMVGARTIMIDNPLLTTRHASGKSPHRVIYDPNSNLAENYHVFQKDEKRIYYFSEKPNAKIVGDHIIQFQFTGGKSHANQILEKLFADQIGILLVEGGSYLLNVFIGENLWDEAWVIRTKHPLQEGVKAPNIRGKLLQEIESATDVITGIRKESKERKD